MLLETDRLLIREFEKKDIDDFMKYRNNLEWMKFQGFKGLSKKEYQKALLVELSIEIGTQLAIIKKSNSKLIGDLYLRLENDTLFIGYTINPIFSRNNYIIESCLALIKWCEINKIKRLKAEVDPLNKTSLAVLNKLNFIYTKTNINNELIYELKI